MFSELIEIYTFELCTYTTHVASNNLIVVALLAYEFSRFFLPVFTTSTAHYFLAK